MEDEDLLAGLRDAREGDLARIVEIYNASIPGRAATADTAPVTVESRRAWFDAHDPARRPLWVLEIGGEIAAWISLRDFYGRPAYAATAEVALYVASEYQARGLGRALLRRMVARCPDFGVEILLGFVFAHNEASMKMNRALGFEVWGRLPRVAELDGKKRDLLIVGLPIDSIQPPG
jgi:phosphinothricin acetyltransferase